MNFEELKYLWQESLKEELDHRRLEEGDIRSLLKKRGMAALSKINRNIVIEMIVVAALAVIFGFMLISQSSRPKTWEVLLLMVYTIASALFYRYKYLSLNRVTFQSRDLKSSLTKLVRTMRGFMRFYFFMVAFIFPGAVVAGLLYGMWGALAEQGKTIADVSVKGWAILVGVAVVMGVVFVFLGKKYVRWLYGVHYDELKNCLAELEESE